ncbi:hypothetical protein JST97_13530 [bacterium]|nr:hypothetical protein [bacterium]
MFGFFRKAEARYQIGLVARTDDYLAIMLDPQGIIQQRRSGPDLKALLAEFPLKQSEVVVGLKVRQYNFRVCDLDSRTPRDIQYEAGRWLAYDVRDASLAWHALGPRRTLIACCPRETLQECWSEFEPLGAARVSWEILELAQLRLLHQNGLPGILLDLNQQCLWMAAACEGNFMGICRPLEHILDMNRELEFQIGLTRSQSMPEPAYVLTNLSLEGSCGYPLRPLPEDYLAVGLSQSPQGPHRFTPANG